MTLYVTPQEYSDILRWSMLPENEYMTEVLGRWPQLRLHLYEEIVVRVVYPDMVQGEEQRIMRRLSLPIQDQIGSATGKYRVVFALNPEYYPLL